MDEIFNVKKNFAAGCAPLVRLEASVFEWEAALIFLGCENAKNSSCLYPPLK